ncbi:hypothetical protein QAD02_003881 [Eretmocerus hayati]|uniref:Uncharacterized protein n=1 Tax=Eretmocerus hayati TaxID=131215 RepID=A0ACC2NND1_9HYME|nr:hypothetical protein QAD02_003881 [Eretmocerus hayati]
MTDYIEVLKIILTHYAYNDRTEDEKHQVFKLVLKSRTIETVHLFIEMGTQIEKCAYLLQDAAYNFRANVSEFLLKTYLFDVDKPNDDGHTPLMIAITRENSACVKLLLEWGAGVNLSIAVPPVGEIILPLSQAIYKKKREILDLIMTVGYTKARQQRRLIP